MGNELPDLWWLMSPEFIQHAIKELNLKGDNEPHYLVLERYTDDLVNRGYLKDARNGRRQSGSPKVLMVHTLHINNNCYRRYLQRKSVSLNN